MDDYELVEPFDIDNGELDEVDSPMAFCLGVEWGMFRACLNGGKPFTTLCLSLNTARLTALCERNGRFVETHNECEGWDVIIVGGKIHD